jgi:hypothetical protein
MKRPNYSFEFEIDAELAGHVHVSGSAKVIHNCDCLCDDHTHPHIFDIEIESIETLFSSGVRDVGAPKPGSKAWKQLELLIEAEIYGELDVRRGETSEDEYELEDAS